MLAGVLANDSVDKGIVNVTENRDGRVDLGKLLNDDDGSGEGAAGTTVLSRSLDTHETLFEETLDDLGVHLFGLVHGLDLGSDDILSETLDGFAKHLLLLGELGERVDAEGDSKSALVGAEVEKARAAETRRCVEGLLATEFQAVVVVEEELMHRAVARAGVRGAAVAALVARAKMRLEEDRRDMVADRGCF